MPVTIQCAPVKPEVLDFTRRPAVDSPDQLFVTSTSKTAKKRPNDDERCLRVQLSETPDQTRLVACTNGLVHTLEAAYNEHLHLVLRLVQSP